MGHLLELFFAFLKIGLISFGGGYASLPVIQEIIVEENGWLSLREMTDVVTISQLTPGPIAVNAASFVGTKLAGVLGAIVATLGVVFPQTVIMLVLAYFLFKGKQMGWLNKMLEALRPGVVGLIASASLDMVVTAVFPDFTLASVDVIALTGFIVGMALSFRKLRPSTIILVGAGLGLALGAIERYLI